MASYQTSINAVLWLFFTLATVAVLLRFLTRVNRNHNIFLDDWIMLWSWALNLAACVSSSIAINAGVGKNVANLSPQQIPNAILCGLIANNIGILADTFPKLAVAWLMKRLLTPKRHMIIFSLSFTIVLLPTAVILVIMGFEQCQPISHQWNRETVPGTCWDPSILANFAIFSGAYSAAVDLFFSLYPAFVVFQLNMALKKRITVMAMLSFGLFTFAVTAYKTIVTLPKLSNEEVDVTLVLGDLMLWTVLEASVVIIAGSVPTWGWLLQSDGFERVITWITMHSLGSSRSRRTRQNIGSSESLAQVEEAAGKHSASVEVDRDGRQTSKPNLDSVAALERDVYS